MYEDLVSLLRKKYDKAPMVMEAADAIEELSKPHMIQAKRKDNGEVVAGFYFCMHHNDSRKHLHHFVIPNEIPIPKDETIGNIQVEINPKTIQMLPLPEPPKEEA